MRRYEPLIAGCPMLIRFANVVYWLGCVLAALSVALGIYGSTDRATGMLIIGLVAGAVFYGIGRGVRYIVQGK